MSETYDPTPTDRDARTNPDLVIRTGTDGPVDPEDLVMADGEDPTPERVEHMRERMAADPNEAEKHVG